MPPLEVGVAAVGGALARYGEEELHEDVNDDHENRRGGGVGGEGNGTCTMMSMRKMTLMTMLETMRALNSEGRSRPTSYGVIRIVYTSATAVIMSQI